MSWLIQVACIITLKAPSLPIKLYIGFHAVNVKIFIPNPLRCINCIQFGHKSIFCKNNRTCALCAENFHESKCNISTNCEIVNCLSNEHDSWSRKCPKFIEEYEIKKIQTNEKTSIFDAKKTYKKHFTLLHLHQTLR